MERYLYRGVNSEMYESTGEKLVPKMIGVDFQRIEKYGYFKYGTRIYGKSTKNAVVAHQENSSINPSSGVSTTPFIENAKIYATHKGKFKSGYVFKIDRGLLESAGVSDYEVAEYTKNPAITDDKEIILVASDCGVLPKDIVVEIIKV